MKICLITSAAYINAEMEAEFGRMPPAFLPLGNKRLYVHQANLIGNFADKIILSVPDDFHIDTDDILSIESLGITLLEIPPTLTLGESIAHAIATIGKPQDSCLILHGDTLFEKLPCMPEDAIHVSESHQPYTWALVEEGDEELRITKSNDPNYKHKSPNSRTLTGLFSFSSCANLLRSLIIARGDFLSSLEIYSKIHVSKICTHEEEIDWWDFGHLNSYYTSRRKFTTERAFNSMQIGKFAITKTSRDQNKIQAEQDWFLGIPKEIQYHTPTLYRNSSSSTEATAYSLEYKYNSTLSDLFVHGRLSQQAWSLIFESCAQFTDRCASFTNGELDAETISELYWSKTERRLREFSKQSGVSITNSIYINQEQLPSPFELALNCYETVRSAPTRARVVMHGDFCFSNILFDMRREMIIVIDPRGQITSGISSIWGDELYDRAKLHHSVVGLYDKIVSGKFSLKSYGLNRHEFHLNINKHQKEAQSEYLNAYAKVEKIFPIEMLNAATALLFLSMLPLHYEDKSRQMALLLNAYRVSNCIL